MSRRLPAPASLQLLTTQFVAVGLAAVLRGGVGACAPRAMCENAEASRPGSAATSRAPPTAQAAARASTSIRGRVRDERFIRAPDGSRKVLPCQKELRRSRRGALTRPATRARTAGGGDCADTLRPVRNTKVKGEWKRSGNAPRARRRSVRAPPDT